MDFENLPTAKDLWIANPPTDRYVLLFIYAMLREIRNALVKKQGASDV